MAQRPTTEEMKEPFVGQWRIVSSDCFEEDYLDLCGEAHLIVPTAGDGRLAMGTMQAGLGFSTAVGTLFFDWRGNDEMDESIGSGAIELTDDGHAIIELEYSSGDQATLRAVRQADG